MNLKNIFNIARNDLRVYFAEPSNLFSLLALPLIMTFILGVASGDSGGTTELRVDVIDLDQSATSQTFITNLKAVNPSMIICPFDYSEATPCGLDETKTLTVEQAQERVQNYDTGALVVIPLGFGEKLTALESVSLTYASLSDISTGDGILSSVQSVVQEMNTALQSAKVAVSVGQNFPNGSIFADNADESTFASQVYATAQTYQQRDPLQITYSLTETNGVNPSGTDGFGQSIPGMGSMFVLFTVFGCISILLKERKQWTLQRLVVLPLNRSEILGGKVLFYFTLGFMQYLVVFAVAIVTGTNLGNDPLALVLIMMSFTFCATGLAMFLATLIKTQQQADGITLLIAMTLAPLGGAWWPLEIVPPFMQTIGHLSPIAWAMEGYRNLTFNNGTLLTVAPNILILVVAGLVLFVLGVRGFEYE